jgi:uncharacterized protein (TIGR04255 family)
MMQLPKKLKKDSIAEALCEVRFESEGVSELVVGRLAAHGDWRTYAATRLPISDIPDAVRRQDVNLRNQPVLELRSPERNRLVKLGSNVLSYHVVAPYCGWTCFRGEIEDVLDHLFASLDNFRARRLGFRYINALNEQDHFIEDITRLNYDVSIAGEKLGPHCNLNYYLQKGDAHIALVRIASPDFVSGNITIPLRALIDVDIFTRQHFETSDVGVAKLWMIEAHSFEKEEFFKLLPTCVLDQLVEEW